jgi:hypothetical protein
MMYMCKHGALFALFCSIPVHSRPAAGPLLMLKLTSGPARGDAIDPLPAKTAVI